MCVGYQPPLPPWAAKARTHGERASLHVGEGFTIEFVPWPSKRNLSYEKPHFLLHVLENLLPEAEGAFFFDSDVVVRASWRFFEAWMEEGVALCLDLSYPLVPTNHPWRRGWRELAVAQGRSCRDLDYYANSGFVGIARRHLDFAKCWAQMIDDSLQQGDPVAVKFSNREMPFIGDQDMLNAAAMATVVPLSMIGPEAMDFARGGYVMSHAVGRAKPWQRRYILDALLGYPPDQPHKLYWRNVSDPITVMPERRMHIARLSLAIGAAIGRFYGRR